MAVSQVKVNTGTVITFKASGGTAVWTPTSLANLAGRVSAQVDLGAFPKPLRYEWRAASKAAGVVVIGDTLLDLFAVTADNAGTGYVDGTPGIVDAALATIEKTRNMLWIGALLVEATAVAIVNASGIVELPNRYFSVVGVNRLSTAVALSATATDHTFQLTPIIDELQ